MGRSDRDIYYPSGGLVVRALDWRAENQGSIKYFACLEMQAMHALCNLESNTSNLDRCLITSALIKNVSVYSPTKCVLVQVMWPSTDQLNLKIILLL